MANRAPRLFTIPASAPFLPVLIRALIDGRLVPGFGGAGEDPLRLASVTLYLPTRRACRLARARFLDALGADAAILPRIVPIGDIDEDEFVFADTAGGAAALDLPPALAPLERRLLLAQLIGRWTETPAARASGGAPLVANTPAAALALADDLAHLFDDIITRQVAWEQLDTLVPGEVDEYWQRTLDFLRFIRQHWPAILRERGAIETAERRDRLIALEAERLARASGPVIAAGSTGSMPATARLLRTIAQLPHGAVVLPGLDTDLDEAAWRLIGGDGPSAQAGHDPAVGHPQYALNALLRLCGVTREAVTVLAEPQPHGRERLLSEALRPAGTTEQWQSRLSRPELAAPIGAGMQQVAVVEAAHADEEALAIAVALREAAETPTMTAALVTPDRALARRVLAALARWRMDVDDSGGEALADTPAGIFARLALDVALGGVAPVPLLALLKHPLQRLGSAFAVEALERAILRGPRPRPGTQGLGEALAQLRRARDDGTLHRSDPRRGLSVTRLDAAGKILARLIAALAPLETLGTGRHSLGNLLRAHLETVAALSRERDGTIAAFAGEDGALLARAFAEAMDSDAAAGFHLAAEDYPDLFLSLLAPAVVREADRPGVRIRILGPLEARLQSFDRIILGGLIEGTWPPEARADPWLSRPMRHALGLDLPERRIGLSAHDFAQAFGAREVILTRPARLGGAPTVASRFLQRLAAVAGEALWRDALERGGRYLALARQFDQPRGRVPFERPAPRPPQAARPLRLSVTEIEHWLRDPYTIYARHILRLLPLAAVDETPGAADRGTVIHAAVAEFTRRFAAAPPDHPEAELIAIGRRYFEALDAYPEARAFWWPRFLRIARWFAAFDAARRDALNAIHAEVEGVLELPLGPRGTFHLTARADRIEQLRDGSFAILDYKTGAVRTERQVRTGLAPQLTLEAAILRHGRFGTIAGGRVSELAYVALRGGEPGGTLCRIDFTVGTPDLHADTAHARLIGLVQRFEDEATPYCSLNHPMWRNAYGEYDHLARIKEWSATGGMLAEGGE